MARPGFCSASALSNRVTILKLLRTRHSDSLDASRAQIIATVALLTLLVLIVLGDLIWQGDGWIASHRAGDAFRSFFYLREFGFSHLVQGDLPLWNPHLFAGTPFIGSFQSAMFYPLNWLYLVTPVPVGMNIEMALHLVLLGSFTAAWARGRGLSFEASIVAASIAMFGAATSLRVLAGALSVLATYAWIPLLFTSIDRLTKRIELGWLLVAGLATTMMLLAGHLPTTFMAFWISSLYTIPGLLESKQRARLILCLAAMCLCSAGGRSARCGARSGERECASGGRAIRVCDELLLRSREPVDSRRSEPVRRRRARGQGARIGELVLRPVVVLGRERLHWCGGVCSGAIGRPSTPGARA
jgi:hypothetical protein